MVVGGLNGFWPSAFSDASLEVKECASEWEQEVRELGPSAWASASRPCRDRNTAWVSGSGSAKFSRVWGSWSKQPEGSIFGEKKALLVPPEESSKRVLPKKKKKKLFVLHSTALHLIHSRTSAWQPVVDWFREAQWRGLQDCRRLTVLPTVILSFTYHMDYIHVWPSCSPQLFWWVSA